MKMIRVCFIVIGFLLQVISAHAQVLHQISPKTVDSLCSQPFDDNYVYYNQDKEQKNKLFIMLHGLIARPHHYQTISEYAANLGFHSIALTYPSEIWNNNQSDTSLQGKIRYEVFDGHDYTYKVTCDTNNCIRHRLLMLLKYLDKTYPDENWGQYYQNDHIQWGKIIISGHSMGGSYAGFIAKIREVNRAILFGESDWLEGLNRTAGWVLWPSVTPVERYYAMAHIKDEYTSSPIYLKTWNDYGLATLGDTVIVENSAPPYNNSHMLFTDAEPVDLDCQYHCGILIDSFLPHENGVPVFLEVWEYLLDGGTPANPINNMLRHSPVYGCPNPFTERLTIAGLKEDDTYFEIYNAIGVCIYRGSVEKTVFLGYLENGIYYIKVGGASRSILTRVVKQ